MPFISSTETLLIILEHEGQHYIGEGKPWGTVIESASDVANDLDGSEAMFILYDIERGYPRDPENVTDKVAEAWLADNRASFDPVAYDEFPAFVQPYADKNIDIRQGIPDDPECDWQLQREAAE